MSKRVHRDPDNRQAIVIESESRPGRNDAYIYQGEARDGSLVWDVASNRWGHIDQPAPTRREAIKALRARMNQEAT